MTIASSRRPRSDGTRSRQRILQAAAALSTRVGLEGLSIALVAQEAGLSKGGVSAHFRSKQALQLQTIEAALAIYAREVLEPASQHPSGLRRLQAHCRYSVDYLRNRVFPDGCFFLAASAEYCGRQGPVKDRIAAIDRSAVELLQQQIETAQAQGELGPQVDSAQLAFELNASLVSANFMFNLHDDPTVLDRAMRAIEGRIEAAKP